MNPVIKRIAMLEQTKQRFLCQVVLSLVLPHDGRKEYEKQHTWKMCPPVILFILPEKGAWELE